MNIEQLISMCEAQGVELAVSNGSLDVFFDEDPSEELLGMLKARKGELLAYLSRGSELPGRGVVPPGLSPGQQRLWLLDRLAPGTPHNNVFQAFAIDGSFDEDVAEAALGALVQHHDSLRTLLETGAGQSRARVHASLPFRLARHQLGGLEASQRGAASAALLEAEAAHVFDLGGEPMLRALCVRCDERAGVLMINVHRSAADEAALAQLVEQFVRLYQAGPGSALPELIPAVPAAPAPQAQLDYWQQRLASMPQLHGLALDAPRLARQGVRSASQSCIIGAGATAALAALARAHGATVGMALQAVFGLVLARYQRSADIIVGMAAPQPDGGPSRHVAPLGNTLVLRTDADAGLSFAAYLGQVRDACLTACAHPDVPFEALPGLLNATPSTAHAPLVQIMFSMHEQASRAFTLPGLALRPLAAPACAAGHDLVLHATPTGAGLQLRLDYDPALFCAASMARFANHLAHALASATANPDCPLGRLDMMGPDEQHELAVTLQPAAAPAPGAASVYALFEQQAATAPHEKAIECGDECLTYAELNARANRIAGALRARGAGPDMLVGLCMQRSVGMVAAMLGILKAGAAYLPLDPAYPAARLDYMLADSGAALLLTETALLASLSPGQAEAICFDHPQWQAQLGRYSGANLESAAGHSPASLAYVIYTSGSTGQPKGVMVEHCNVVHFLDAVSERLGGPGAVWLGLTAISFDISVLEIFGSLSSGARLAIAPGTRHGKAPPSVGELIARHGVTHLQCTPSRAAMLLADPVERASLTGLTALLIGGEACSPALAEQMGAATGAAIYNMYGPTEATVWASSHQIVAGMPEVPVGAALAHYRLYVVDQSLNACPFGVPGELLIGGAGVARGYLGRSALTAERFIQYQAAGQAPERVYRTGDLVRYMADGALQFLGRIDSQVKLRGFRIELGEIEAQLMHDARVSAAAVVVREFGPGDQRLVAYVAAAADPALAEQLREQLARVLPDYMVPAELVVMDALPQTANGKLDRNALPAPGHAATEATAAVADDHGVRSAGIARAERAGNRFPLSFAQQRLWFIDGMEGGSAHYNMPGAFRIRGQFSPELAQQGLEQVIARHEVLRAQFHDTPEGPYQSIRTQVEFRLALHDLSALAPAAREAAAQAAVDEDARRPFTLASDLMLRAAFLRMGPDDGLLLLNMHHIASDGWSIAVLVGEFATIYEALRSGAGAALAPLPVQYTDYAAWQRSAEHGAAVERQLAHWKQALADCPRIHGLPLDKPRPAQQNFRARSHTAHLDAAFAARLGTLARQQDATLFMLLHSAFAVLLSRWSGEHDIVLAVPSAGRSRPELEPLIGFFVNTLVFRTDLSGQPRFDQLLRQCRDYALNAYANQEVPFEVLVDALRPERDLAYNPLCQVKFLLQNQQADSYTLPGIALEAVKGAEEFIRFDLDLTINESAAGLELKWSYKDELFKDATIERMAASFTCLLRAIVDAPATAVAELALLDGAERADWLRLACGAEDGAGRESSMVAQFEASAARHGETIAVRHGAIALSYTELNAKANRLAHYLIEQGVASGQLVGIYVERSPELMVAILGVLKTGAAYIPLEPKNTRERLGRIVADACLEWVLVQPGMADRLPPGGIDLLLLDEAGGAGWLDDYPAHNPGLPVSLDDSAYVIYTSGSTGAPKGVQITHAGLIDYCAYASGRYYDARLGGALVVTSHGFDITVPSLYLPLLRGGCVQFLEHGEELVDLAARLAHPDCPSQLLRMTPMHVRGLLELLPLGAIPAAHVFVVGGEAFTVSLARELQQRFATSQLYNHYGPTETVVGCAIFDISANLAALERVLPIGRPMDNTRLYVLNAALQPCPAGVAGELHIGGAGVARGYLNQPELTAAKFIADPFMAGQRLYKSGDLVRRLAGGDIEFIARVDDQVKLRGYRIELGEIRAALLQQEQVREAFVMVQGEGEHKRLAAWLVATEPVADDAAFVAAVQAQLKLALPEYMVPAACAVLAALPLSANGKIDVRALPAIDAAGARSYQGPRNAAEEVLCAIWQQLLKVDQVGVHDNFFTLGGDSILSIQVVARANQAGLGITTRQLFAHQSVAELALHAGARRAEASQQPAEGPIALLPVQRQFLALSEHVAHYNQCLLLEAPAGLDVQLLAQLMAALYRRHDALRLCVRREGDAWQSSHAPFSAELLAAATEADTLPDAGREAFIAARCGQFQRSFNPERGPLLRALLLQGQDGTGRLFLAAHHLVVDGVSWRILLGDLELAFGQLQTGRAIALAARTSSFQQWGQAVAGYAGDAGLRAQLGYWLAQLTHPVPALPHAALGEALQAPQSSTRSVRFALDAADTEALLKRCAPRYRTQINELLLAGVCLGLRAWSGAAAVRLTLEGHGREDLFDALDTSQTVGWFTTTYPLALACDGADTGAVICQVKEQLRSVPQRGFGYGVLRHISQDSALAEAERANPSQLLFNYLGQFDQQLDAGVLRPAPEATGEAIDGRRPRQAPLVLNGKVAGGVLDFVLDFSELQFAPAEVQRLAALMAAGLREVIGHCAGAAPDRFTPSDFPLAAVGVHQLDQWQQHYRIAKLYPATSMQQGMLFHSMLDSGAYVTQTYPVLSGELDMACFRAAWDAVSARHDIFRTVFVGQGEQLHQLVLEQASVPWSEHDWRGLDSAQQQARFAQVREDDRVRGFDPTQAPLQRIAMFRLDGARYQLLWTHHHMLLDGWCTPLVYRDVMNAYARLLAGQAPDSAKVPPYQDYIAWLGAQDQDQARTYWRTYLAALDGPTTLRLPRPESGADGEQRLELDAAQTAQLAHFVRSRQSTLNTVLQLAWGYLLHSYSGERHVLFGTTISGRPAELPGVEEMVGLFINTIPVRVSFDQSRQVDTLLGDLQQAFQASTSFGYLPLTDIAQCSGVAGASGLFDSLLVFENYPIDAALDADQDAGIALESMGSAIANGYGLTLNVASADTLRMSCVYSGKVLDARAAGSLLGHLKAVLLQIASGAASVDDICLLDDGERQRMLVEWNDTGRAWADQRCVHARFEQAAELHATAVAVRHGGAALSFEQLNTKANRLAHYLIEQGVGAGQRVGIYVERSPELMVAILGVLKAGAAYIPFEPKNTRERLGRTIADAGVEWVLAQPGMADRLPSGGIDLMLLDGGAGDAWLDEYPSHNPALATGLDDSAYVIYTSGSTGVPKGVEITHGGLMDYCAFASERYYGEHLAGALVVTSHGFDITVPSLYLPLLRGGCVELLEHGEELADLAVRLARPDCPPQLLRMTPMHVRGLLDLLPAGAMPAGAHVFVVGGEAFTVSLARQLQQRCPASQLFNHYGPTETVVGCAMFDISANLAALDRVLPIGRPMANTRLYVLNAALQPCPVGVAGELHIGGAGVARGYLNQPQLTAAKFITDPFTPAQRLYKTGDLVRFLDSGDIEFIARVDDQVKLRGYRIELGEIRAVLLEQEQVREAVVLVHGEGEHKRLMACLVAAGHVDDEAGFIGAVQARLRQALPDYMVPAAFALLPHLPLTANGKLDQRSLLSLGGLLAPEQAFSAPASATEKHLAQIWQALLGGEEVSASANFFDIGGHSLLAMRLINAIQTDFGIACSLKALLANPTITAMAEKIDLSLVKASNDEGANNNENTVETEW